MTTPQVISVACSPIKALENVQRYNLSHKVLDESSAEIEANNLKIGTLIESNASEYECTDESSSEDELFAIEQYKKHMLIGTIMSVFGKLSDCPLVNPSIRDIIRKNRNKQIEINQQ
ncbi:hypothetical protein AVEN_251737-1 [Araneus ventricosus]|uniref:Uncharacterized protein n=1 Tax=Araneus ventricosus TaxID=182803 RepID=A0A4Y2T7H2_ARAVE|nr:hypothetical protein AVEN_251737-1 [Araneus ventricosus]